MSAVGSVLHCGPVTSTEGSVSTAVRLSPFVGDNSIAVQIPFDYHQATVSITNTRAATVADILYLGIALARQSHPNEHAVMGLDAQEVRRPVNSYEGSAGLKESGRS
ncbi:uncharacterized protein UHOD_11967 [Ustilago sp. UG-2017b]|nr:uncharacterized protein UHOD_11967 [Ustilago sp. UG-2017b]